MAFSVAVPTNDDNAEAKIAAQYATDPGASPDGHYVATDDAIMDASKYPDLRFFVVGNKHPNASTIGVGKDVMGGDGAGEMSATCYWGLELHTTQKVPIGLYHTSYGGSAVEDWISAETLGDGKTGPCPGPIIRSMGLPLQQWNGQLVPLLNTTIKGTIWYQGESNCGQNELYSCRYEQLMQEWRNQCFIGTDGATEPNFKMGFVQIGPMENDQVDSE